MTADVPTAPGIAGLLSRNRLIIALVLVATALAAWLPGFVSLPPVDRDEPRYVQASKQMVETGNVIDIRFQDETRHKKPVGIYWMQAISAATVGDGPASPLWVYRLPSLLGAVAAVLLTAVIGARMFGPSVGLLAGIALATSVILGVEARLAKTDAALLAFILLGQWALWQIWSRRREPDAGGYWWLLFWLAQGIAILIKGPVAPALAALTIATLVIWDRSMGWIMRLRPLRGGLIAVLIAAPWLAALMFATEDGFAASEFGVDALAKIYEAQEGHGAPPGTYLLAMWGTAWPFVVLVPLAMVWLGRHLGDDRVRFLIAWILGFWLLMEIAATKLPHYVLPTYPALAIACAAAVLALQRPRQLLIGVPLVASLLLAALLVGGSLLLPALFDEAMPLAAIVGALVTLVLLYAVGWAFFAKRFQLAGITGVLAAIALYVTVYETVLARMEALALSPRMAEAVATHATCAAPAVGLVGYHEPSAVFLLGTETQLTDADGAATLLGTEACALAFVDDRHLPTFEGLAPEMDTLATLRGYRVNGGRFTTLTLVGTAP